MIKDPKSDEARMIVIQCIKEWTKHDPQFDLRDGIFTIAPTSTFLAINAGFSTYAKLVFKKDESDRIEPIQASKKLREFFNQYPEIVQLLGDDTYTLDTNGNVVGICIPKVWAEPYPGNVYF